MTVTIRTFIPEDQPVARRLVLEGLGEHFGVIDQSLNPDLDDIQQSFIAAEHAFFVAEYNGEIVGTVGLLFESGRARIVRMSVVKNHRKEGIATQLLERCIKTVKDRGLSEIVAFTEHHWSDAVGFYVGFGFEQCGSDHVDIHLRLSLDGA